MSMFLFDFPDIVKNIDDAINAIEDSGLV